MFCKTDNRNLAAKLSLRRYGLDKYRSGGAAADVFDCCQGDRIIWSNIDRPIRSYWGVDVKPKRGRLSVDAKLVVRNVKANVIDIDTYGDPMPILKEACENRNTDDLLMFMTWGQPLCSLSKMSRESMDIFKRMLGDALYQRCPPMLLQAVKHVKPQITLLYVVAQQWHVEELFTVDSGTSRTNYYGLKLTRRDS